MDQEAKATEINFSDGGFIQVNKPLIHCIGLNETLILTELLSMYEYCKKNNQLDFKGGIYCTFKSLKIATGLKQAAQESAIKNLKKFGLIDTYNTGVPNKRHFIITEDINQAINMYIQLGKLAILSIRAENPDVASVYGNQYTSLLKSINQFTEINKLVYGFPYTSLLKSITIITNNNNNNNNKYNNNKQQEDVDAEANAYLKEKVYTLLMDKFPNAKEYLIKHDVKNWETKRNLNDVHSLLISEELNWIYSSDKNDDHKLNIINTEIQNDEKFNGYIKKMNDKYEQLRYEEQQQNDFHFTIPSVKIEKQIENENYDLD